MIVIREQGRSEGEIARTKRTEKFRFVDDKRKFLGANVHLEQRLVRSLRPFLRLTAYVAFLESRGRERVAVDPVAYFCLNLWKII